MQRARPVLSSADVDTVTDPHAFLGVKRRASVAQIKAAFREQVRHHHPDVSNASKQESEAYTRRLFVAYGEAIRLSKGPMPLELQTPQGLTADERMTWLTAENKVVLFMRGTKQQPSDSDSEEAVATLSMEAFGTNQKFAAINVELDPDLEAAVTHHSGLRTLPVCYIDGGVIGGTAKLESLHQSGELRHMFGAADVYPPCPSELFEWRDGKWQEPETWAQIREDMRLQYNPWGFLQWVPAKKPDRERIQAANV
jgi:glutaredoxin-related protein